MAADSAYSQPHEKTIRTHKDPYGCHSRGDFAEGYWAPDGHVVIEQDGIMLAVQKLKFTPHVMSRTCRLVDLWDTDPRCYGCTTTKDREYGERMKDMK